MTQYLHFDRNGFSSLKLDKEVARYLIAILRDRGHRP
jgi:hypothetical protein